MKKISRFLIMLLALVLACGGVYLRARSQVSGEARVMPGVSACGTDVSGMSREQVLALRFSDAALRSVNAFDAEADTMNLPKPARRMLPDEEEFD